MKVVLKKWTLDERKSLVKMCNEVDRSYLSNRIPYPYTEADAEWWINMANECEGKTGVYRAIVVDGEYVGNISIEQKSDVNCKDAEIGYMLSLNNWSKGIMTEAVQQMIDIAFKDLDIVRITGIVFEPNKASQRVLEKNGFKLEGVMKKAVFKDDNFYDQCIYGIVIRKSEE